MVEKNKIKFPCSINDLESHFPTGLVQNRDGYAQVSIDGNNYYYLAVGNDFVPFTDNGKDVSTKVSYIEHEGSQIEYKGKQVSYNPENAEFRKHEKYFVLYVREMLSRKEVANNQRLVKLRTDNGAELLDAGTAIEIEGTIIHFTYNGQVISSQVGNVNRTNNTLEYKGTCVSYDPKDGKLLSHDNSPLKIFSERSGQVLVRTYQEDGRELRDSGSYLLVDGVYKSFTIEGKDISHEILKVNRSKSIARYEGNQHRYNPETLELEKEHMDRDTLTVLDKKKFYTGDQEVTNHISGISERDMTVKYKGETIFYTNRAAQEFDLVSYDDCFVGPMFRDDISVLYKNTSGKKLEKDRYVINGKTTGTTQNPYIEFTHDGKSIGSEIQLKNHNHRVAHYKEEAFLYNNEGELVIAKEDGVYHLEDEGDIVTLYRKIGDSAPDNFEQVGYHLKTETGSVPFTLLGKDVSFEVSCIHRGGYSIQYKNHSLHHNDAGEIITLSEGGRSYVKEEGITPSFFFINGDSLVRVEDENKKKLLQQLLNDTVKQAVEGPKVASDKILGKGIILGALDQLVVEHKNNAITKGVKKGENITRDEARNILEGAKGIKDKFIALYPEKQEETIDAFINEVRKKINLSKAAKVSKKGSRKRQQWGGKGVDPIEYLGEEE